MEPPRRTTLSAPQGLSPFAKPDAPAAGGDGAIELSEDEAELVGAEAFAASRALGPERGRRAEALARAAASRRVPPGLLEPLGEVLLASLEGGRARRLYRAEGERLLAEVFERTPRGAALRAELDAVNGALRALRGRALDDVRVGARVPGRFTVSLSAGGVGVTLVVRPDGVAVESLSA